MQSRCLHAWANRLPLEASSPASISAVSSPSAWRSVSVGSSKMSRSSIDSNQLTSWLAAFAPTPTRPDGENLQRRSSCWRIGPGWSARRGL
eukprot:scaffold96860_cov63-Phaeocystis_antarctica.AAC.2